MKKYILPLLFLAAFSTTKAQLADSCKLQFGTNLAGITDYMTEMPFVDLMHNCRTWFSQSIDDPNHPFNSGFADSLSYRADGYPTHMPQIVSSSIYRQKISTIWGNTSGWPTGTYTVLYDGTGSLYTLGMNNIQFVNAHKFTFDFTTSGNVAIGIDSSLASDPVHNIRVLMPGSEATYLTQPFNPLWLSKFTQVFKSVRFMDWGYTNGWGQSDPYDWDDSSLFSWADRAQMNHYTWADTKGVPYEMMIKLMNTYKLDGWACVPHRANNNYIQNMAILFRDSLSSNRKLYVEYSNETWNWIFGQAQWLNKYGCTNKSIIWPEGTVPYVQNCLNIWTNMFSGQLNRLERVAAVQTGWQDVSNRVCYNLTKGSFDAVGLTYYFALNEKGDSVMDSLGSKCTVADVAHWARNEMPNIFSFMQSQKKEIADSLHVKIAFYEGGHHLTPIPFGVMPTYCQALLDVQRDTAMYNMYNEWFDRIRTLQSGNEPLQLMNFSFVSDLNCQYGSWGILETLNQNLITTPAPKWQAILKNQNTHCSGSIGLISMPNIIDGIQIYPNPTTDNIKITSSTNLKNVSYFVANPIGQVLLSGNLDGNENVVSLAGYAVGIYFVQVDGKTYKVVKE